MNPGLPAACRCAMAVALCAPSTGCIFLGAYPFVQDVTGPVRGVRVLDSETMQDIPEANASLNVEWTTINQYRDDYHAFMKEDEKDLTSIGFLSRKNGLRDGLLTRRDDGVFKVPKRILPGVGIAALCFADGPGYIGPLGRKHGESGYQAVITAWAPGYKPLQVAYHAPLFAKFQCHGGNSRREGSQVHTYGYEFEPQSGVLQIKLREAPVDVPEYLGSGRR